MREIQIFPSIYFSKCPKLVLCLSEVAEVCPKLDKIFLAGSYSKLISQYGQLLVNYKIEIAGKITYQD
jgi:hypothetical protein